MATSKEKKRFHLTATADGWSVSNSAGGADGGFKTAFSASQGITKGKGKGGKIEKKGKK